MSQLNQGTIGILPTGALGVSFYYHLTQRLQNEDGSVRFIERAGSASAALLRRGRVLRIADSAGVHEKEIHNRVWPDLIQCHESGSLPEILLVCTNPDQLLVSLTPCVQLLEQFYKADNLDPLHLPLPTLVLCSNGIYFQRIRQVFLEKLEEATLLGRLPDLWPDLMPRIVGKLMRGVTIQTGIRQGDGVDAIYRPGPRGITRLAGGDTQNRERAHALLEHKGLWVEAVDSGSPTRAEFDKALVNLVANLLGQWVAIDETGKFTPLTISQVLEKVGEERVRELGHQVIAVGRAVRAYGLHEEEESLLDAVLENLRAHGEHSPSSLQWLEMRLKQGQPVRSLTPTELWLLDPLIHYARSAELESATHYFENLKRGLQEKLQRAYLI